MMKIHFIVVECSSDPGRVGRSETIEVHDDSFVPRAGDFCRVPGIGGKWKVDSVLVEWMSLSGLMSCAYEINVFVDLKN